MAQAPWLEKPSSDSTRVDLCTIGTSGEKREGRTPVLGYSRATPERLLSYPVPILQPLIRFMGFYFNYSYQPRSLRHSNSGVVC